MKVSQLIDGAKGAAVATLIERLRPYRRRTAGEFLVPAFTIIGAGAVGVLVGMMFAPKEGQQFRADVARKASELRERAMDVGERAVEAGNSIVDRLPGQENRSSQRSS